MTFSPDADFPLINIEKGGLHMRFTAEAEQAAEGIRLIGIQAGTKINVVPGEAKALIAGMPSAELEILAGAQGRSHLSAILAVRDIKEVKVYDIMPAAAERYAQQMSEKYGIIVTVAESVEEAVKNADIVCTVTPCREAYLKKEWIKPGTHINAVGTFSPTTREVTSELVAASRLIADSMEGILKESGEYLIPAREGLIDESHIAGTLGELVTGKKQGRVSEDEITLFDALGLAVEDVASAAWVLEQV